MGHPKYRAIQSLALDLQILTKNIFNDMYYLLNEWINIKFVVEDSKFIDLGPISGRRVHKDAYLIHIFFFGL